MHHYATSTLFLQKIPKLTTYDMLYFH